MELGTELGRDGTKTEPIFVLIYNVSFKVLLQSRPSAVPSSIQRTVTQNNFWETLKTSLNNFKPITTYFNSQKN